jgi:hypothetical protein
MALQHSLTLPIGVDLAGAYTRITNVSYTKDELIVNTETFASSAAREALKPSVASASYSLPWSSDINLAYCYGQLKSVPEFLYSMDV